MATNGVQAGLSRIQFSDQDLSRGLLAVSIGVFTYEIISKAVHKVADETFSKIWMLSLAASTITMLSVSQMELSRLQGRFIALFAAYVLVSILATKKPVTTSSLPKYMVDMVEKAKKGDYPLMRGYETPLENVEIFMNKETIANAVLVAFPGVGKSTIPQTIACKIAKREYPRHSVFFEAKLVQVTFAGIMAGTKWQGVLEERIQEMVELAKKDPKLIFWIDEIQNLIGGGESIDSRVDLSDRLMEFMTGGQLRILGATTIEDYNRYIKPNLAFARRLPKVVIDEPNHAECFKMLRYKFDQKKDRIEISSEAIAAAIVFSKNIPEQYFPAKANDLIETAESRAKLALGASENKQILTEHHIAQAALTMGIEGTVDSLIRDFRQSMSVNPLYFPSPAITPSSAGSLSGCSPQN